MDLATYYLSASYRIEGFQGFVACFKAKKAPMPYGCVGFEKA